MNTTSILRKAEETLHVAVRVVAVACFLAVSMLLLLAHAGAQATGTLQGNVADGKGGMLPKASVTARNVATGKTVTVQTDASGHYMFSGLPEGSYDVTVLSAGFQQGTRKSVTVPSGDVSFALAIGSATSDITVEADVTHSAAAALAPMDALLGETSARTEITAAFINNFTSPVSDYGEAVAMAPATFTLNGNGVGLGQSKTYFRGFPDGLYDIKFDGIPWSDTNSVSHHSWAFFPSQFLGGIDFDRSPGTASTVGFAPFGGSINLLSKETSPFQNIRASFSGGSANTYLYDIQYDSGSFGPGKKLSTSIDVHHLQSHGYQTGNNQTRNAGAIKVVYALSSKTTISGYSDVIWLDSNTPNFSATRCQMYGAQTTYTCTGSLAPFAGSGKNFLLTNNADPLLYLDQQYNFYHVPTDFEYVGLHTELGKGFTLDIKPYTYNYDNSEKYSNAVPITDNPALIGTTYATLGTKITTLCNQQVVTTKKGNTTSALPCSVDKYNSYRQYGETSELTQVSRFGIMRAGLWYNWSNTNRHQYPTDPLNNYQDQALPNFAEKYVQDSYQPYAEYQLNLGKKLTVTPGVKFSYFTIGTQQFADNGSTVGCLTPGCDVTKPATYNVNAFIANGGTYFATLPSAVANYRIASNWSAYVQYAQGTVAPPSNVFDFQQGTTGSSIPPAVLPKQQKNTTYQAGTVIKLKRVTFDADYYHIHFDNSYSSTLNALGEPVFFAQPSSLTQGLEGEANLYFGHGLSLYLNASYDHATYMGTINQNCSGAAPACVTTATAANPTLTPQLTFTAPSGLDVAQTPSDVETEGITYQKGAYDLGIFNKRVGTYYIDNGGYHDQLTIRPFTLTNAYANYTIRSNGRLNGTKFRLSVNNLLNVDNVTGTSLKGSANTISVAANGTTYVDPFNTVGQTPINGGDTVSILPGRSVLLSVTFGFSPKGR